MLSTVKKILIAIASLIISTLNPLQGNESSDNYCCSCGQFFIDAQFLYLRAFEENLTSVCDSIQITESVVDGILVSKLQGEAHDLDFQWDFGFRVGGGYTFADSNCDFEALWTHYTSSTYSADNSIAYRWKIDFNVIDALYGCECPVSPCFALTPFGGIRYANIYQKLSGNMTSTIDSTISASREGIKENFFGAGPFLGLEGAVGLRCGFSLYANIGVGVLYGMCHVTSKRVEEFDSEKDINLLRKRIQACQPIVDAGLGIRCSRLLCYNTLLTFQLELEHHRYFNHNQLIGYGDLCLDGLSLSLSIAY